MRRVRPSAAAVGAWRETVHRPRRQSRSAHRENRRRETKPAGPAPGTAWSTCARRPPEWRMMASWPTAQPCCASGKWTPVSVASVGRTGQPQVLPPSVERRMWPLAPTATTVLPNGLGVEQQRPGGEERSPGRRPGRRAMASTADQQEPTPAGAAHCGLCSCRIGSVSDRWDAPFGREVEIMSRRVVGRESAAPARRKARRRRKAPSVRLRGGGCRGCRNRPACA